MDTHIQIYTHTHIYTDIYIHRHTQTHTQAHKKVTSSPLPQLVAHLNEKPTKGQVLYELDHRAYCNYANCKQVQI